MYLQTNSILKHEKYQKVLNLAKKSAQVQRAKFFHTHLQISKLISLIKAKGSSRIKQRDKIQIMYRSYFTFQLNFSKFILKSGPNLDQRLGHKVKFCLNFLHNVHKEKEQKCKKNLKVYLKDVAKLGEMREKCRTFGKQIYLENRRWVMELN